MSYRKGNNSQTRLYIGRISPDTRAADLQLEFQQFGRVQEVDVKRGFAFVEYYNQGDAAVAQRMMDGVLLNGCSLSVEFSRKGPRRLQVRRGGSHEEVLRGVGGPYKGFRGLEHGPYNDFQQGGRGGTDWSVRRCSSRVRDVLDERYAMDPLGGFIERKIPYGGYPAYARRGGPPPPPLPKGRAPLRDYDRRQVCYNCGREGHFARDCREGDWRNKCYACGQSGHIRSQCPKAGRCSSGSTSLNGYYPKRGRSPAAYRRRHSPSPLPHKRRNRGDISPSPSPSPLRNRGNRSPSPGYRRFSRRSPSTKYGNVNGHSAPRAYDSSPSPSSEDLIAGMHEEGGALENDWKVDDHDQPAAADHNPKNTNHQDNEEGDENTGTSNSGEDRIGDCHVPAAADHNTCNKCHEDDQNKENPLAEREGDDVPEGEGDGDGDDGKKSPAPATSGINPNVEPCSSEGKSASDVSF